MCADGYQLGSSACGACAPAHYSEITGACVPCPAGGASTLEQVRQAASFLGGFALFGLIMGIIVLIVQRYVGGTVLGGIRRAGQFFVFAWLILQLLVQAGRAASPSTPKLLLDVYSTASVVQFEGISLPPVCTNSEPLQSERSKLSLAVILACVFFVVSASNLWTSYKPRPLTANAPKPLQTEPIPLPIDEGPSAAPTEIMPQRSKLHRGLATATKLLTLACGMLYALFTNTTLRMLSCEQRPVTINYYATQMLSDGATLLKYGVDAAFLREIVRERDNGALLTAAANDLLAASIDTQVLTSNPSQVCREANHAGIYPLAIASCVLFVVGFPLYTFITVAWQLHRRIRYKTNAAAGATCANCRSMRDLDADTSVLTDPGLSFWVASDFRVSCFWMKHLDITSTAILSALLSFLPSTPTSSSIATECAVTVATVFTVCCLHLFISPFAEQHSWKRAPSAASLVVVALVAISNAIHGYIDLLMETPDRTVPPSLQTAATTMSIVTFVGCVVLVALLLFSLFWAMLKGSQREAGKLHKLKNTEIEPGAVSMETEVRNPLRSAKSSRIKVHAAAADNDVATSIDATMLSSSRKFGGSSAQEAHAGTTRKRMSLAAFQPVRTSTLGRAGRPAVGSTEDGHEAGPTASSASDAFTGQNVRPQLSFFMVTSASKPQQKRSGRHGP